MCIRRWSVRQCDDAGPDEFRPRWSSPASGRGRSNLDSTLFVGEYTREGTSEAPQWYFLFALLRGSQIPKRTEPRADQTPNQFRLPQLPHPLLQQVDRHVVLLSIPERWHRLDVACRITDWVENVIAFLQGRSS